MFSSPRLSITLVTTLLCAATLAAQTPGTTDPMAKDGMMKKDTMAMPGGMAHDAMGMMGPKGSFAGANKHTVSGSYEVTTAKGKTMVNLSSDFALDGAPDPYVVLSSTDKGDASGAIRLGKLQKPTGAQSYAVPAGTDLKTFTHVLIYCKKFNVTLGQADLASGDAMMHSDGMMKHDTATSH